jgi:hypothetical protein
MRSYQPGAGAYPNAWQPNTGHELLLQPGAFANRALPATWYRARPTNSARSLRSSAMPALHEIPKEREVLQRGNTELRVCSQGGVSRLEELGANGATRDSALSRAASSLRSPDWASGGGRYRRFLATTTMRALPAKARQFGIFTRLRRVAPFRT